MRQSAGRPTRWINSGRLAQLADELGEELLAESRSSICYALSISDECAQADGVRQPTRAIRALDVLCLLFGDAT